MKMKFSCAAAIAAILVGAPWASIAAPDVKKAEPPAKESKQTKVQEKAPEKAKDALLPEKPDDAAVAKALKAKKPMYTKFADAADAAWKCQQPLIAVLLADDDERSKQLESKAVRQKAFIKDFVPQNCVLLVWRLKTVKPQAVQVRGRGRNRTVSSKPTKPTAVEARSLKPQEVDFLTRYAVSALAKTNAKRKGDPEPKFTSIGCYPTVVCVDPGCRKLYFRDPKYDASLGSPAASFGAWFSQTVDMFRTTKREPVISPAVQKILDNPTEPKKWK